MDSSDKFYSHFPSYSEQSRKREALAKEQKLDYQAYLKRVTSNKNNREQLFGKIKKPSTPHDDSRKPKIPRNQEKTVNDSPISIKKRGAVSQNDTKDGTNERQKNKEQFLNEWEKMNLPEIVDGNAINARNRRIAEEKRLQNIRYQEDLKAQIEQKKRERELQKTKEREEEERLTRRMEEQLKSVRLQYEMERERPTRRRDRVILDYQKGATIGHSPKPPNTIRSESILPQKSFTYQSYDERKAQSDNGKENINLVKRNNDNEIYKFFKNSAREPSLLKDLRYQDYGDFSGEFNDFDITPNSMSSAHNHTYPSITSQHKQFASKNGPMCNFCKEHRFLSRNHLENINRDLYICRSCEDQPICLNCRKEICVRCKMPTNREEKQKTHPKQSKIDRHFLNFQQPNHETSAETKYVRTDNFRSIEIDNESLSDSNPDGHKPYSFNIDESSVFHPLRTRIDRRLSVKVRNGEIFVKPDSFDELKRIADEKVLKLAKNYGELSKTQRVFNKKQNKSNPLPLVKKENTRKLMDFAKQIENDNSNDDDAIDDLVQIQTKWPVDADAQQTTSNTARNNDNNAYTFTQIGAFKKQLNLDKFNLDDY